MAKKVIHQVQVTITKYLDTGRVAADCQAIATLPEVENTRFGVSLPMSGDGVTELIDNAISALKDKMAEGGHTVEDAVPPEE